MSHLDTRLTVCRGDLADLREAGARLLDVMHALQRKQRHVPSALVGDGVPQQWAHYPEHDVFDADTGYRYFYHSHPGPRSDREHGHFHLFARAPEVASGTPAFTHLVAISMAPSGLPLRAFTTNRWVTDERWQAAAVLRRLLDRFAMRTPKRFALVHRWLEAVVRLFRPQIDWLIARRDERWQAARASRPNYFEDRRSSVLSECALDLSRQFAWLERLTPAPR